MPLESASVWINNALIILVDIASQRQFTLKLGYLIQWIALKA